MCWRLQLSEFNFQVVYKKESLKNQADAMPRTRTLEETTVPTEDEVPCFTMREGGPEAQWSYTDEAYDEAAEKGLLETELKQLLATVPIILDELKLAQRDDKFDRYTVTGLSLGEVLPFAHETDCIIFKYANGDDQICIPQALQPRVLQISHHTKM